MRSGANGRRVVILAEGGWGEPESKTGMGYARYGADPTVAIIDSTHAGGNAREALGLACDIPIVGRLQEADRFRPTTLVIGVANPGGYLPEGWLGTIRAALERGMEVWNGLHLLLGDDPELARLAAEHGTRIVDFRRPLERLLVASGRAHRTGSRVVLTVGTDCALGKMSVALELRRAAREAGLRAAFVPTGQTGMMIDGWGIALDRIPSDFVAGLMEQMVERAEGEADWIFVEGQGSLDHPAYSGVTLGILHGCRPHAMILCDEPTRRSKDGWPDYPVEHDLRRVARVHEEVAGLVAPSVVAAIALDTHRLDEAEARRAITAAQDATGLVADDALRFGPGRLFAALRESLERPVTAGVAS